MKYFKIIIPSVLVLLFMIFGSVFLAKSINKSKSTNKQLDSLQKEKLKLEIQKLKYETKNI